MGKYLSFTAQGNSDYIVTNNNLVNYFSGDTGNTSTTIILWGYMSGDWGDLLLEWEGTNPSSGSEGGGVIVYDIAGGNTTDFQFWDGAAMQGASISTQKINQWTQFAITYSNSTGDLFGYINGVSGCTANFTRVFPLGSSLYYLVGWSHKQLERRIGSFKLFNTTLGPIEIEQDYLSTFDTWVCPILDFNTDNPESFPGPGSGDTIYDLSFNSNMVLYNAPASGTSFCNTYLTFDPVNTQYGQLASTLIQNDLFKNDDISIFMWVYPTAVGCILSQTPAGGSQTSIIEFGTSGAFYFGLLDGSSVMQYVTSGIYDSEQWHYVGFTYNDSTGDLIGYVDGQNVGVVNFSQLKPADRTYELGKNGSTYYMDTTNYFSGRIGTLRVWNRVLTPGNVLFDYLRTYNSWNCPIIYYDIENVISYPGNGTGDTVTDLSTISNATLVNGVSSGSTNCNTYLDFVAASSQYLITDTDITSYVSTNNEMSLFMWVNFTNNTNGVVLSELGQSTIDTGFHYAQIEVSGGTTFINILQGGPSLVTNTLGFVGYDNWNYIGFTWDNDNGEVVGFLNGVSAFTQSSISRDFSWTSNGLYYSVAAEDSTFSQVSGYSDTQLGEFQFFGQTLTPQKVLDNYNETFTKWVCPILKYDSNNILSFTGTGATGLLDLSGNGIDSLFGNNTPLTGVSNCYTYLSFSGANADSFTTDDIFSYFPNLNKFSIFLWIYLENYDGVVIGNTVDGTRNSLIEFDRNNNLLYFGLYNGVSFDSFTNFCSENEWHYVGITYDGITLNGYVDGDNVGSVVSTWQSPTSTLDIITRNTTNYMFDSNELTCRRGTLEVWNKVLPYNVIYDNYVNSIKYITNNCTP